MYLEEASRASVLDDFNWNEDSFRQYVTSSPHIKMSELEIGLLWRSFSHYAYHPLPHQEAEIDFAAFKRAAVLLVFQADDLIGTQEMDGGAEYCWRQDATQHANARHGRLFRSLGVPGKSGPSPEQTEELLGEAADVMALSGPKSVHRGPTPEELKTVARRFLEGSVRSREVRREEIETLIGLLGRLSIKEDKWGSNGAFYNHGDILEASSSSVELSKILAGGLVEDMRLDPFTANEALKAVELMPNLLLRFYQLWAVIFQPRVPSTSDSYTPPQPDEKGAIIRSLLLFVPHIVAGKRFARTISQPTEEISITPIPSRDKDKTLSRLLGQPTVPGDCKECVVLFSGTVSSGAGTAVIGVYFSRPLNGGGGQLGNASPYLLFQLRPRFRVLKGQHGILLRDPISTQAGAGQQANGTYMVEVGRAREGKLEVRPWKGGMVLVGAGELLSKEKEQGRATWEVAAKSCRMDIFGVNGGVLAGAEGERDSGYREDYGRKIEVATDDTPARVTGDELLKRIQGFGPG
ncbi:hypothetical protein LZ554_003740 [Drepanopeziza brunnea f. sp. 'monogermtubi']|nr:hypothetical protein LZ554_003740 [Drepanopeziza brunnea f. sp. 'monogermtubi']